MVFETFKEFLPPKHFSLFGYIVVVIYLLVGIISAAVATVYILAGESEKFVCDVRGTLSDKDYIRSQCHEKYNQQFSPFPLFGFALLNFGSMAFVCVAYSLSVKSRIARMEALNDPENPRPRARLPNAANRHTLFTKYLVQILSRAVLGIVFVVLQLVTYPLEFPSTFDCTDVIITRKPTNQTVITNSTQTTGNNPPISCFSSSQNDSWNQAILFINTICLALVLMELYHLWKRRREKENFTRDMDFCRQHLNLFKKPESDRDERDTAGSTCIDPLIGNSESREGKFRLDDFVHVLIYTGRGVKESENFKELPGPGNEIPDRFLKAQDGAIEIKTLMDLFEDTNANEQNKKAKKILIVGCPGIGKSVLCKKLLKESHKKIKQKQSPLFKYLFLFELSSYNLTEKVSLKTLLKEIDSIETFQDILDNPEKVLLVFDGLDEFKGHSNLKTEYKQAQARSTTEEMSFLSLYANLLKDNQNLLPGATVVTTCRPSEWDSIKKEWFCKTVEIMGFSNKTVKTYLDRYSWKYSPSSENELCPNVQTAEELQRGVAEEMWKLIRDNVVLLSLCRIPVICCIICSHLNWLISKSEQNITSLPLRVTQVFKEAMKMCIFTRHHDCKGKEFQGTEVFTYSQEETISKLGSLAKKGIELEQHMFRATDVKGMENCGLLHRLPDSQVFSCEFKENFSFIQPSFQKFLAAREIAKMEPGDLREFIKSNISNPKWHLVIQFVAGLLCGQEKYMAVDTFVSILRDSFANILCDSLRPLTQEQQQEQKQEQQVQKLKALLMIKCLYEYDNETTVNKAASELKMIRTEQDKNKIDLSKVSNETYQVTPFDLRAIVYFINLGKLTKLDLSDNKITDEDLIYLCNALNAENCTGMKLVLRSNQIKVISMDSQDALIKSKITKLDLTYNDVTHQGVLNLCHALEDENCKLEVLRLSNNNITNQGASHLSDALKRPGCKLTKLHLSRSKITYNGVLLLCDALQCQDCQLTKLNLSHNNITADGVTGLCDALMLNRNLLKLFLSKIIITDETTGESVKQVSKLCDALKNCKLTKLNLSHNQIAVQSIEHLCGALKEARCELTELNLSNNKIADQSIEQLCAALKHERCKLKKLNLDNNNITDQGVSHLCEAMKDENCKLTELYLGGNQIKDDGVSHLCIVLKDVNNKLLKLNLSTNEITDRGVSYLCNALEHINSKHTEVKIENMNTITSEGYKRWAIWKELRNKFYK